MGLSVSSRRDHRQKVHADYSSSPCAPFWWLGRVSTRLAFFTGEISGGSFGLSPRNSSGEGDELERGEAAELGLNQRLRGGLGFHAAGRQALHHEEAQLGRGHSQTSAMPGPQPRLLSGPSVCL